MDEWPNRTQPRAMGDEQQRTSAQRPLQAPPPSEPHGPAVKQHDGRGVDVVHQPGGVDNSRSPNVVEVSIRQDCIAYLEGEEEEEKATKRCSGAKGFFMYVCVVKSRGVCPKNPVRAGVRTWTCTYTLDRDTRDDTWFRESDVDDHGDIYGL